MHRSIMGVFRRFTRFFTCLLLVFLCLCAGAQPPDGDNPNPAAAGSPDAGGSPGTASAPAASAGSDVRISVAFGELPIERVLQQISQKSGKNVVPRGKTLGQRVSIMAKEQPLERILDQIVNGKPNWLWYKPEDMPNTYEIWDQDSFRAEVLPRRVRQKVYIPREITAEEAFKAVQGVLTPNIGAASFDPRSNKLIVTDLPEVLELIQRLIEQIDVRFMTRVFYITHADINAMAERLSNLKSPAAPPPEVDEKTHQIIVRDRLDIIRQMELLVETLDIGPEMRVYDLNNLEFEGQGRQDLEDSIQQVLTPNAFWKINVQSGKMLVEDIPEIHEKVEKILAAFDQPAKQVLVQAEIIETEFQDGFNYAINWAFSGDLFSSVIDQLTGLGATPSVPTVPQGAGTETAKTDPATLGFLDFRKEFPVVTGGSSGVFTQNLSKHAFVALRAVMSDSRTRILQQPRALVKNQKEVIFSVGQKVPYFTGGVVGYTQNTVNNATQNTQLPQQNLIQVGLDLNVRPTINNNGLIEMEIEIRNNTAFTVTRVFNGQPFDAVGTNNQEMQSTLIVPSGETRVIGGLVTDQKGDSHEGVPGLSRIPVIGPLLFGSYNRPQDQNRRRNLLLFITPTIVLERPRDLYKYKGRVIVDETEADLLTSPSATLSDVQCEPLPVLPPVPAYEPGEPVSALPAGHVIQAPPEQIEKIGPEESVEPAGEPQVIPLEEQPPAEEAPRHGGVTPLKRVRIAEHTTTGPAAQLSPRIAGPSGALTGTGPGSAAGPGPGGPAQAGVRVGPGYPQPTPPSGQPTAGSPVRPPSGPAPSFVAPNPVVTPYPTPYAAPVMTPQPSPPPPPPPTPPPSAPPPETRF